MLQNNYSYTSQRGVPGGLFDSSPYSAISRANGETSPIAVKYGYGVVKGDTPGVNVILPTAASAAADFEGVVMTDISERDAYNVVQVNPTKPLGILEWGKIWVRVADGLTIDYGDSVYLIQIGADAGKFTNVSGGIEIKKARFIQPVSEGDIAAIVLYNAPNV